MDLHFIVPNLVYSARGSEVLLAAVDGQVIMEHGHVREIDGAALSAGIRPWGRLLSERSAEAFHSLSGPNQEFMNTGKY